MPTRLSGIRLARRLDEVGFSDIVQIRNKVMAMRISKLQKALNSLQSRHSSRIKRTMRHPLAYPDYATHLSKSLHPRTAST